MFVFRNSDDAFRVIIVCLEIEWDNKFCLFVLFTRSFILKDISFVISRPVLHYEVFKVPLCFSATALLIYSVPHFLSRGFLELFKFFFDLSDEPEQRLAS